MILNFIDEQVSQDVIIDSNLLDQVIVSIGYEYPFNSLYIYGYKIDNKGRSSVNVYYEPFANVNRNSTQLVYNGDLSSQIMDQINS